MPFDPDSPFAPAGADGIDDWFVPGQSPGRIAPWSPQTDHLFPDDWIYPDNRNAPTPPAAPSTAPPAPSPQPNPANPVISNRPAPPPDPIAAYWALIPANRLTAVAWHPPIFPGPVGERPEPIEAGANVGDVGPPTPAGGRNPPAPLGRGKQYEQEQGSQQTTRHVIIDGKNVTVRLDFPPTENGIVDLKNYNWSSQGYEVPFLRQKVTENFQAQIRKYQAIHPQVRFKFSAQPPQWVEQALEEVGGTYFVEPQ